MGKSHHIHHQNRAAPPQTPPSRPMHRYSSKDTAQYLPPIAMPRTPSPPSSPPEMEIRTPMLSGGSTHPWDRSYRPHHMSPLTPQPFPSLSGRTAALPPSSPLLPQGREQPQGMNSSFASGSDMASQEPELTSGTTVATPQAVPQHSTPYNGHPHLQQEETWQTLYPSEIAAFDTATLRLKLSQSNAMLTKLSSLVSEERTRAAHFMFQLRLLTIETNEAMQRHQVEADMAKREVEILRKDGPGGAGVQHRGELEDAIDLYKKRLRRVKLMLRDAREEVLEVRLENDLLKKRIRENRQHRIQDLEAHLEAGHAAKAEEEEDEENDDDDGVAKFDFYNPTTNGPSYQSEVNQTPRSTSKQQHLHELTSSPGRPLVHVPQTPRTTALDAPGQDEDALTTLGLLASQVLSQAGFSEPQTPRKVESRYTPRSTTPVRGLSNTVPSTPLSQTRNHPGPATKTPLPQTPRRRNGAVQPPSLQPPSRHKDVKSSAGTGTSVRKAAGAGAHYGTPAYTSPAIGSSVARKQQGINGGKVQETESPIRSEARGKKRRLSSDSTLSATNLDDEADSLNESEIEEVIKDGSPTPQITRTGRILSNGTSAYLAHKTANRNARFNKRTRGQVGEIP